MASESHNTRLGPYELTGQIGRGRNARVYRAIHTPSGRVVAVKVFSPKRSADPDFAPALQQLIERLSRVVHPHVLPIIDSGTIDNLTFIVTPFIARHGLDVWLNQAGPVEIDSALAIMQQAGSAIDAAQENGIVHGSIHPANLLIDSDGAILVSDFGLAALFPRRGETTNQRTVWSIGQPEMMAPEVAFTGEVTPESDVYSLGGTLYTMLTGQVPYPANSFLEMVAQHRRAPTPQVSIIRDDVPPAADAVIAQAMAKSPGERPHRASDIGTALESIFSPEIAEVITLLKGAPPVPTHTGSEEVIVIDRSSSLPLPGIPRWIMAAIGIAGAALLCVLMVVAGRVLMAPNDDTPGPAETFVAVVPAIPTDAVTETPVDTLQPTLLPTPTESPTASPTESLTPELPTPTVTFPPVTRSGTTTGGGSTGGGTTGGGGGPVQPTAPLPGLTYTPGAVFTLGVIMPQTPGAPPAPSGNAIIFVRNGQIFAINPDGSGSQQLTSGPGTQAHPTRGGQISFSSNRDGNSEIYIMSTNGTGQMRLTNDGASDTEPSWSIDGTIAFASTRTGGTDIYVVRTDGVITAQPVNHPAQDRYPGWAPGGGRLVFASNRDGGDFDLFAVNTDGSNLVQITATGVDEIRPVWSPDGGRIAYISGGNVFVLNLGNNASTAITSIGGVQGISWSPDGAQIVFAAYGDLYVIGAEGGAPVRIASGGNQDTDPAWAR